MIGCTKLLCGTATVSEALQHDRDSSKLPPHMLQFSSDYRPLVVWNTTNRCNLSCQHCYLNAEDRDYEQELTNEEARAFIADIAEMQAPVLLFSGGEPLLRKDLFELAAYAKSLGLRPVLSSNGTLITPEKARQLFEAGFQYVGVSIDGLEETHDRFRGRKGAFRDAIEGLKNAREAGLKTGARFTVNADNAHDLAGVIDYIAAAGIPRFCMYHLVYAGRGSEMVGRDTDAAAKRQTIETVLAKTKELADKNVDIEILTVDNHADGVYLRNLIADQQPERLEEVEGLLDMHGGCSAGTKMSNVDPYGNVHPCQFWGHVTLGNVKERKFSEIWKDPEDPFLKALRDKQAHVKGRCGSCDYRGICGGCRIRAEAVTGDMWEADPACYLTDEEIHAGGDAAN
jgi:radical SAM protein with 4Fe4S-binding SPASM domain